MWEIYVAVLIILILCMLYVYHNYMWCKTCHRFVRNCQNEAKLLTKSGEILVDFGKNNLLNESFFKHRTFLGECMFSADTSLLMKNVAQYLTKNNEIQRQESIVKDMEKMFIDAKEKLARMKHILKESKS